MKARWLSESLAFVWYFTGLNFSTVVDLDASVILRFLHVNLPCSSLPHEVQETQQSSHVVTQIQLVKMTYHAALYWLKPNRRCHWHSRGGNDHVRTRIQESGIFWNCISSCLLQHDLTKDLYPNSNEFYHSIKRYRAQLKHRKSTWVGISQKETPDTQKAYEKVLCIISHQGNSN